MFTIINIKEKEYKLRMTTKAMTEAEKRLGKNPINMLMEIEKENSFPMVSEIVTIFWAALLPLNSGITYDKAMTMFDEYLEDGHTLFDSVYLIMQVFKDSGFLTKGGSEKN